MEQTKLPDQLPMNMEQQDLWSLQPSLCTLDVWIHKGSIHALSEGVKQQERFYCDIFKVYSNIYNTQSDWIEPCQLWIIWLSPKFFSVFFGLKTPRNAMKPVINEGGGHIWLFLDESSLGTVGFRTFHEIKKTFFGASLGAIGQVDIWRNWRNIS